MRIVDNKISTTWCQSQLIQANTTFNAYVVSKEPEISDEIEKINMRRYLVLKDGSKEYWGFYLLKGSTFEVSSCVRWPGASLIIIEGHKNLKECAYVGDNSSEETDFSISSEEDKNVTVINHMTKVASGMILNNWKIIAANRKNTTSPTSADTKSPPKTNFKRQNVHLKYAEELYLNENRKKLDLQKLNPPTVKNTTSKTPSYSDELLNDIVKRLELLGTPGKQVVRNLQENIDKELAAKDVADEDDNNKSNSTEIKQQISEKKKNEILAQILEQVDKLVKDSIDKGSRPNNTEKKNSSTSAFEEREFRKIHKEIMINRIKQLNLEKNNDTDTAAEVLDDEDKADIHGSVKNSKNGDRSKSEFWSSFSSSEERLLECKGLLASLPLIPYHTCEQKYGDAHLDEESKVNAVSYTVQTTGYYFFIFNNENEVKNNFIHAHFSINKTIYNTSAAVASCKNESKKCSLPLTFWSQERTIIELPKPSEDALWNEEFIFVSKCEPRSTLYLLCFLSVPLCLLLFAFT
ncbi:uncharacterized protein LOC135842011 isoform X2 [Planococcus citri]